MASSEFRLKFVLVLYHYLAGCSTCGTVVSVVVEPRANALERKDPKCRRCGSEMEPDVETVHAEVRFVECQ